MAQNNSVYKGLSILFSILIVICIVVIFMMVNSNQTQKNEGVVVFETTKGDIEIELFLEQSPVTAGNFKSLVEQGFYDGTRFHRVISDFMIQGGDPLSRDESQRNMWGTGGPGYAIDDEFIDGLSNVRGTLSMANSGPNTGGSQFFINLVDNQYLDWNKEPMQSKHPVFGRVISGLEIVDMIGSVETNQRDQPLEDIVINRAYVR